MLEDHEIYWHDLTPEQHPDSKLLPFHPDISELCEEMNSRQAQFTEMSAQLGDGDVWTASFKDPARFGRSKGSTVCAKVVDTDTFVVATLVTLGSEDKPAETIMVVPVSRIDRFDPDQAIEALDGVATEAKGALVAEMKQLVRLYKCGSLALSCNTTLELGNWFLAGRTTDDFRPTLVRAMLRWALGRDGASPPNLVVGSAGSKPECKVHKDSNGAYRFTVLYPWGTHFSNAFVLVLKDLGYGVVRHPVYSFCHGDSEEWFASKNADQLKELVRVFHLNDDSEETFEDRLTNKVDGLSEVKSAAFDWKHLESPEEFVGSLERQFGVKIHWSRGGNNHGQRREFYQFLVDPPKEVANAL
jgi:hypothetical protein